MPEAAGPRLRLRGAGDVTVVNLSQGGALVESTVRMLPGRACALHLNGTQDTRTLAGEIIRCELVHVEGGKLPLYRAAIAFSQEISDAWVATTRAGTGYPS
jgi:hypothetical protein